jgi:hypothetical protein
VYERCGWKERTQVRDRYLPARLLVPDSIFESLKMPLCAAGPESEAADFPDRNFLIVQRQAWVVKDWRFTVSMRLHTWHLGPRRQPVRPVFLDELCSELANVALGAARRLRLY